MGWYVIDAVERAMERTRTCLFEPVDIWKWLKLTIIVLFIGGGFSSGGNGGSYNNYDGSGSGFSRIPQGFIDVVTNFYEHLMSYSGVTLLILAIILIFLFILLLSLIGSVMEFVFVESLVRNDVRIREYFSRYLMKGVALFILRILIGLGTLLFFVILALPLLFMTGIMNEGIDRLGGASIMLLVMGLIAILFIVAIIAGIIGSFINLAIPVSMYSKRSIYSALSQVLGQFRHDWQQIVVYWVGRLILAIAAGILVAILGLIAIIALGILLLIVDFILYFGFSAIIANTTVWLLFIPILLVEFIIFIFVMTFVGMPVKVFMKYHMLTFLEKWYPIGIPMFDSHHKIGESNMDEWLNEATAPDE
ncbi:hypothetical protein RE476_03510 [Methanolobus mangrovi]|uniref:DUF4013 domain-containing protein n=1 Tax=Methanolobus mangrovi TaxID=3072977 RepID=A0AA51UGM6_9EURY|nr:hypothetical protein [Methanolobus mangrovi]WMW22904.1 hypothetical protein RE476_03510 [Methanolobus mangrovi]